MLTVGIDIGGTFTDIAAHDTETGDTRFSKVLTTHGNLTVGVTGCLEALAIDVAQIAAIKHGTTVVINALLERKGARTALVTTKGFRDILEIGRGNRPVMFDLFYKRSAPLAPRNLRFEVDERVGADGAIIKSPARDELERIAAAIRATGCAAVAVSFINSYLNSDNESAAMRQLAELLPDVFVSSGTAISKQWYEYERTATAVANAYVGPTVGTYLDALEYGLATRGFTGSLMLMGSSGGVMSTTRAHAQPIALVESGPVGGCIGAAAYGEALGYSKIITFDMGGTTAKCALVEDGEFDVSSTYYLGGYEHGFPVRAPVLDIIEVGAGGGSIAWVDEQKRLRLGPQSAGSSPGPACYALGGVDPTVTDANLVLGRISPRGFRNSQIKLDAERAAQAIDAAIVKPLDDRRIDTVAAAAKGILSIATATMATAIRRVTVERGRDPREYVLFAYGGGGPLHAADIARELHIRKIVVPASAGVFSAVGMLMADASWEIARTSVMPLTDAADAAIARLFEEMHAQLVAEHADLAGVDNHAHERVVEIRYVGQNHTLPVRVGAQTNTGEIRSAFESLYQARFGHAREGIALELIGLRLTAWKKDPKPALRRNPIEAVVADDVVHEIRSVYYNGVGSVEAAVYQRADLSSGVTGDGPCVIEDFGSTILVGPAQRFEIGVLGEIILTLMDLAP